MQQPQMHARRRRRTDHLDLLSAIARDHLGQGGLASLAIILVSVWHVAASRFYRVAASAPVCCRRGRPSVTLWLSLAVWSIDGRRAAVVAAAGAVVVVWHTARRFDGGFGAAPPAHRIEARRGEAFALPHAKCPHGVRPSVCQHFAGKCARQNGDFPLFHAAIITTGRQGVGPLLLLFVPAKIRYFSAILARLGEEEWVGEASVALGLTMALDRPLAVCMQRRFPSLPLSPTSNSSTLFSNTDSQCIERSHPERHAQRLITLFAAGELSYPGRRGRRGEPARATATAAL